MTGSVRAWHHHHHQPQSRRRRFLPVESRSSLPSSDSPLSRTSSTSRPRTNRRRTSKKERRPRAHTVQRQTPRFSQSTSPLLLFHPLHLSLRLGRGIQPPATTTKPRPCRLQHHRRAADRSTTYTPSWGSVRPRRTCWTGLIRDPKGLVRWCSPTGIPRGRRRRSKIWVVKEVNNRRSTSSYHARSPRSPRLGYHFRNRSSRRSSASSLGQRPPTTKTSKAEERVDVGFDYNDLIRNYDGMPPRASSVVGVKDVVVESTTADDGVVIVHFPACWNAEHLVVPRAPRRWERSSAIKRVQVVRFRNQRVRSGTSSPVSMSQAYHRTTKTTSDPQSFTHPLATTMQTIRPRSTRMTSRWPRVYRMRSSLKRL